MRLTALLTTAIARGLLAVMLAGFLTPTFGWEMVSAAAPHDHAAVAEHHELRANLSAAAHLIHGSSAGRFTITYAPGGLSRGRRRPIAGRLPRRGRRPRR